MASVNPTSKPNPIPVRYRRITPAPIVRGAVKALEFYTEVFQATERTRFPGHGETVAHAEIEVGDSVVIVEDESPYLGTKAPSATSSTVRRPPGQLPHSVPRPDTWETS
jgi:PhnB protein